MSDLEMAGADNLSDRQAGQQQYVKVIEAGSAALDDTGYRTPVKDYDEPRTAESYDRTRTPSPVLEQKGGSDYDGSRGEERGRDSSRRSPSPQDRPTMSLIVRGLSFETSPAQVRRFFEQCGKSLRRIYSLMLTIVCLFRRRNTRCISTL